MKEITLTLNGKECKGLSGDTILDVARKNEVYIPTLCWLEGLLPIGACRMCVVEVEGNNKMLTACTTPAQDGMKIFTGTEKLMSYRKQVLELLFAGRNHYCMYCSQSGDCELQRLAIEHGIDSIRYPYLYAEFHNDTSNEKLQMDHNRCMLCLRCIRVCAEKVGAHTLDLQKRGWGATITADLGRPLGDSHTCVNCGACAQVCPTGTITVREFAYRGKRNECDAVVESVCPLCSVGCKIKAYVRTGSVVRVEGADLAGPDGGQLCEKGRWWLPESTERKRLSAPMVREGAGFVETTWDNALSIIESKLSESMKVKKAGALVSSLCTDEELALFRSVFKDGLGMESVDTFDGDILRGFIKGFRPFAGQGIKPFTAAHNILESDLIINLCANPQQEAPVVGSYIRVAVREKGAQLVNISCSGNPFGDLTDLDLVLAKCSANTAFLGELAETVHSLNLSYDEMEKEIGIAGTEDPLSGYRESLKKAAEKIDANEATLEKLVTMLIRAKKPVLVLGGHLAKNPKSVTEAVNLAIASKAFFGDGVGVVPLFVSGNSLGAFNTLVCDEPWLGKKELDFLYVFSTGMIPEDETALSAISRSRFVVVHTPYMLHPLVNLADILLPSPAFYERSGHFCTIEGERRRLNVIVPPARGFIPLSEALGRMAGDPKIAMSRPTSAPCEELFAGKVSADKAQMVSIER